MTYSDGPGFIENLKRLATLFLNDVRLTATEKLSRLLSTLSIVFIVGLLGLGILLFLSYAFAAFLSAFMYPAWAYLIVCGIYALLIVLLVVFRRVLVEDPVTMFLSKILLPAPENFEEKTNRSSKHSHEE